MSETKVFEMTKTWQRDVHTHYCPGCMHGVAHRLVCEAIDELGIQDDTIGIAPVGCAVVMHQYIDVDFIESAHGRAPVLAYGIKAVRPDKIVFSYQGDGDLASIGAAEVFHSLNRADNTTLIYINNAMYGMTGAQMSPTTLLGQKTTTCPYGRTPELHGYPMDVSEMATKLPGACFVSRQGVDTPGASRKAKKAIRKAFEANMAGKGSSMVEIVATCSSGWKLSPEKANEWLRENMFVQYPKGDLKDTTEL